MKKNSFLKKSLEEALLVILIFSGIIFTKFHPETVNTVLSIIFGWLVVINFQKERIPCEKIIIYTGITMGLFSMLWIKSSSTDPLFFSFVWLALTVIYTCLTIATIWAVKFLWRSWERLCELFVGIALLNSKGRFPE